MARRRRVAALVRALEEVETEIAAQEKAERELEKRRAAVRASLQKAHAAGATYKQLAEITGLSPSRIAQLITGD
jgi:hypothetical protein